MILPFGNARRTGEHAGAAVLVTPGTAWFFQCDAELTGSPAWDGDLVVVLDVEGGVHGLDAGTGERCWSHPQRLGPFVGVWLGGHHLDRSPAPSRRRDHRA
ncbi:MAG: PQQ-binding-like beta-propeller repeat protein [Actinomadura sp.]